MAGLLGISAAEHLARTDALLARVREAGASGVVLFDRDYILYYSGFSFIPTERPIVWMANAAGETGLLVPRLEKEHAEAQSADQRVFVYTEYPDLEHPMQVLVKGMSELGITGSVCADMDGCPRILGYDGPTLSEAAGVAVIDARPGIEAQLAVKSEAEVLQIRESVRWGNLAHTLLQRYTAVGATETEVSQRASNEATRAMLDAIGPIYQAQAPFGGGAHAGYRGQIGRGAAIPHAMSNNVTFQAGEVLVTGAAAAVWGYNSELERTMLMGPASDAQKRMFDHMLALQDLALAGIKPGGTCASVDDPVRAYYAEHDLTAYWRHHSGHSIGLRYHEGPFLDIGDETVIASGMLFTVEPGLYVPELGGFRHSDTVLVTEDGIEMLTYYPRDLASLMLPV